MYSGGNQSIPSTGESSSENQGIVGYFKAIRRTTLWTILLLICDLIAEFCAMWAASVEEPEKNIVYTETSEGSWPIKWLSSARDKHSQQWVNLVLAKRSTCALPNFQYLGHHFWVQIPFYRTCHRTQRPAQILLASVIMPSVLGGFFSEITGRLSIIMCVKICRVTQWYRW